MTNFGPPGPGGPPPPTQPMGSPPPGSGDPGQGGGYGPGSYGPPGGGYGQTASYGQTSAYGPPGGYGPGGPGGPPPPGFGPQGPQPFGPPPGAPPAQRPRRTWLIVTAIVTVLALGAGGVVLWNLLGGKGGASTSNEAVTLLAADLQAGKTLDALSRLHPAERTLAVDSQATFTTELKRLEIIRPDADPNALNATFADLRFDESAAETVRDDVVITKLVGGKITFTAAAADSVFTDQFKSLFPPGLSGSNAAPATIDIAREVPEGIRVATVKVDGKWYVSAFYTAADYVLKEAGTPWPKTSVAARGAPSANEALKQTIQAAMDGDVKRLIELAPPTELQVLHDVGDALISSAGRTRPTGVRLIDLRTTESSIEGGTALQLDKIVLENEGEQATFTREGPCIVVKPPSGAEQRICNIEDAAKTGVGSSRRSLTGDPAVDRVVAKLYPVITNPKIVVTQSDGQYYVSPFRTVTNFYGDLLRALDAQDIRDLVAAFGR